MGGGKPGGGDAVDAGAATDDDRAALAIFSRCRTTGSDVVRRRFSSDLAGLFVSRVLTRSPFKVETRLHRRKEACLREMKSGSLFVRNEG